MPGSRPLSLTLLLGGLGLPLSAAVELPALISDHAVIQAGEPVQLWGWADAGEKVVIRLGATEVATVTGLGKDQPWRATLPAQAAGAVADLTFAGTNSLTVTDILAGEVWLGSGQSNMVMTVGKGPWCGYGGVLNQEQEIAAANDDQLRVFTDSSNGSGVPQTRSKGSWQVTSPQTVPRFSATAYFFARELRQTLKRPVGMIVSAVGGTAAEPWTPPTALAKDPGYLALKAKVEALDREFGPRLSADQKADAAWKLAADAAKAAGKPAPPRPVGSLSEEERNRLRDLAPVLKLGNLYHGKIHPLAPYTIAGAVWYQGESNARRGEAYALTMTGLITGWRADWGKPFPFVFVALAGFDGAKAITSHMGSFPLIREAAIQVSTTLPGVGVVSAADVGNAGNIHPPNKQAVGKRAGLWALEHVYQQPVTGSGPGAPAVVFTAGQATVTWTKDQKGLRLTGPGGFELAGADQQFVAAQAVLQDGIVTVTAPGVTTPVALRYAFLNHPTCTVYNGADLPALPFRTDSWPLVMPRKP